MTSCDNTGQVRSYDDVIIKFNNKKYRVKKVYIGITEYIHVVYPVGDTLVAMPRQVVQQVSDGDDGHKPVTVVELN